jgi:hypothetical protein
MLQLDHGENKGNMQTLTKEIIEAAIAGFEGQKQRINEQIAELRGMLNGGSSSATAQPKAGKKRKFSASALQRMREAQQRRWAKVRGESVSAMPVEKSAKPKRRISAAGRKAIAEAQKKRWAATRAGAKKVA